MRIPELSPTDLGFTGVATFGYLVASVAILFLLLALLYEAVKTIYQNMGKVYAIIATFLGTGVIAIVTYMLLSGVNQ